MDFTIFLNSLQPTSLDSFTLELIRSEQGTTTFLLHLRSQVGFGSPAALHIADMARLELKDDPSAAKEDLIHALGIETKWWGNTDPRTEATRRNLAEIGAN